MSHNLKEDILNAVRNVNIGDPSTKKVNWPKPPIINMHTPVPQQRVIYVNESNSKRIKRLNGENKDLQDKIKELEYSVEHLHKVIDTIGVKERFYYKKLKDLGYNPDGDYAIGYSSNSDYKLYASCTGYKCKSNSSKSDIKVSRVPRVTSHKVKIKNCFKSKSKGSH